MALVRYGNGVAEIRGSVGGMTYSRGRSGGYVRTRVKPVQPNSSFQLAQRGLMAALVTEFTTTLTGVQRAAWLAYSQAHPALNRLGESFVRTAQQMFTAFNLPLLRAGYPSVQDAPQLTPSTTTDVANPIATITAGLGAITWTVTGQAWAGMDDTSMVIELSDVFPASRTRPIGGYRLGTVLDGDSGTPITTGTFTNPWGAGIAGQAGNKVRVRYTIVAANGYVGQPVEYDITLS